MTTPTLRAYRVPGVVQVRRARSTGAIIRVLDNRAGQWTTDGERGYTECLTHGDMAAHDTRRAAHEWASDPCMWCDGCRGDAPD